MHESHQNFFQFKQQTIQKLTRAIENNEVDEKIIQIISSINKLENYVTTSSCAGRIILLQLPEVGDKKKACFLGRWHNPVSFSEIKKTIGSYENGQLWFITQSPIFHIATKTIDDADYLLKIGISSGFKHSGFKTSQPRIIVELLSTERMDVPLAKNGKRFCDSEYLQFITDLGNDLLLRSQKKLKRLQEQLIQNTNNEKKGL